MPAGAGWCSLCHADLREPTQLLGVPVSQMPVSEPAAVSSFAAPPKPSVNLFKPRKASRQSTGRHSAGAVAGTTTVATELPPAPGTVLTVPTQDHPDVASAVTVESEAERAAAQQAAVWAEQVLAQLREAEPGLIDPETAPGGKWGMAAAGTAAVIVVLLLVYTLLGFVIGR